MPSDQFHRVEKLVGECENWQSPTLLNSFADAGINPGYYKDPFNVVHLKGQLDTGTSGTVAFTLPEGYRPDEDYWQVALQPSAAAGAMANIQTDGDVVLYYTGASITINGISWRV